LETLLGQGMGHQDVVVLVLFVMLV
jgi:hypothetical protein